MPLKSALNTFPGQMQRQPGKPMPMNGNVPKPMLDGIAYAGGNPNFDERTGQFINQGGMGQGNPVRPPQQEQLTRLSPGVYRNSQGQLVNQSGSMLPNQPDRSQQSGFAGTSRDIVQNLQPFNPNGFGPKPPAAIGIPSNFNPNGFGGQQPINPIYYFNQQQPVNPIYQMNPQQMQQMQQMQQQLQQQAQPRQQLQQATQALGNVFRSGR